MEQTVCPLHVPLGRYCAETILERHAASLPDLTGIVLLTPNATSSRVLQSELSRLTREKDIPGLLLPPIAPLRPWVCQHSTFSCMENDLSELLELITTLHQNKTLQALNLADSWSVARELMNLFEQLWLNEVALPSDPEELKSRLRSAYGIKDEPPKQFGMEADIIHLLWEAWDKGSADSVSSGKFYREALLRLDPPGEVEAIYVCGHDRLSLVETHALARLHENVPVSVFTRPQALIPFEATEPAKTASFPASPYADVLREAFAMGTDMLERARTCRQQHPDSPLQGRLHTFVADQAEPHARSIDIQIRRWLRDGHRNIGLVTEDRKLARRVRALADRAGVEIRDYAGWALSTTSAASVIDRWLECLGQDFHYLPFLDVLKSPFVDLGDRLDQQDHVGSFEQRLYHDNVHGGLKNYRRLAEGNDQGRAWLAMLDKIERAARPMLKLGERVTGERYFGALLDSLERLDCLDALMADDVGEKILLQLKQMRFRLAGNDVLLPRSQWTSLLRQTLERENYRPRSHQDAVSLINLNQAHLARFDHLIVAGMDSRHYPGLDASFLVFNDSVRADLGLPTSTALRALSLQRFLSLLLSSEQVLLTYQKTDQDEPLLPSVWWTQIDVFHRLAYGADASLEEPSLATLSLDPGAWVRHPDTPTRLPSPVAMPKPCASPELLPSRISASAHQALIDCPYRFFVSRMLRIREPEGISEEIDPLEFGSYVHRCLEAFHTDVADAPGPWQGLIGGRGAEAIELLSEIGRHFMERMVPHPSNVVSQERWESIARRFVKLQKSVEQRQTPVESEHKAEREIGNGLRLYGIVDRVDESPGKDRIVIDYKTGSSAISQADISTGEQVQLPTYALLVESVKQVEYWWLSKNLQKDIQVTSLAGEELEAINQKIRDRLLTTLRRLSDNAEMPAHGDTKTCTYCYAQGVCRKDLATDEGAA